MTLTEEKFAYDTLERYAGCDPKAFRSNLIITNFPQYVTHFAELYDVPIHEGSMFKVAHSEEHDISILDFKIGTTAAALTVDICSFLDFRSSIFLGMCGGLRRRYKVGDYLVPIASIRGEGTSDNYFPPEVPALSNFLMSKAITEVMEEEDLAYHVGITFTSNIRFWEFNETFKKRLTETKAQAIELECATLFTASYRRKFTLGSLLLISDMPLESQGIKTKESSKKVFEKHMDEHVKLGIKILKHSRDMQNKLVKGAYHRNIGLRAKRS